MLIDSSQSGFRYAAHLGKTVASFARSSRLLFGVIASSLLLSACDLGESNVEQGLKNQVLHLGNGTEPQDLDPHIVTGVTENNIISALFEGLVSEHPETLAPMPGLAESWTVSDDGLQYQFRIRADAKWSNGEPVSAEDFVWSWQRILSPTLGAEYAYQLYPVAGAEEFNTGKLTEFSAVGVRAPDAKTLVVTLNNPTPYFLSLLTHYSTYAVHPDTVKAFGEMDERGTKWTRPGNLVGNGPFTLKSWRLNYLIEVEKNPLYWDADKVKLSAIRFYPIDNAQSEERMFRTGALHVAATTPSSKIAVYQAGQPDRISISPYLGTYFYRFNVTRPPLDNALVRRALSMSIDREAIISAVTKGGQLPAFSFTPPDTQGYFPPSGPDSNVIQYDIEQARALLAEAGYPQGQGFRELELLYNTSDGHRKIAEAIQQMWKKALGIEVRLVNTDWKVYLSRTNALDYDVSRAGWIGDYPDPNTFLDMMLSGGGNNRTGWQNPEYDALINQAATQTSQADRYRSFTEAEKILNEQAPLIPIYTYTRVSLKHPSVKNWFPNILDHHPYKYVFLE